MRVQLVFLSFFLSIGGAIERFKEAEVSFGNGYILVAFFRRQFILQLPAACPVTRNYKYSLPSAVLVHIWK